MERNTKKGQRISNTFQNPGKGFPDAQQELRIIPGRVFPEGVPNKGSRKGFPEYMINTNVTDYIN